MQETDHSDSSRAGGKDFSRDFSGDNCSAETGAGSLEDGEAQQTIIDNCSAGAGPGSGQHRIRAAVIMTASWAALIAVDLLSKTAAAAALKGQPAIVLIPGVLEFLYVENTGAAFSMLQNAQWLFILVAVLAIAVIGALLHRIPDSRRMRPLRCLLLVVSAGAAGNLIDRLLLGYVRDFIYFSLIDFPVFNVADIYVTCSVAILAVLILFRYDDADFGFLERRKGTGAPS